MVFSRPALAWLAFVALGCLVACSHRQEAPSRAPREMPAEATASQPSQPAPVHTGKVRVVRDGALARSTPDSAAEATMRLNLGDTFDAGDRVEGWVELADAPVPSWAQVEHVEAVAMTTEEARAASVEAAAARAKAEAWDSAKLEIVDMRVESDWSRYRNERFGLCRGVVRNVSNERLMGVVAHATWETADGAFIVGELSPIELQPILPGQESEWRIRAAWNPAMEDGSASVAFFLADGTRLPARRADQ